jgi:hypothetical protein
VCVAGTAAGYKSKPPGAAAWQASRRMNIADYDIPLGEMAKAKAFRLVEPLL